MKDNKEIRLLFEEEQGFYLGMKLSLDREKIEGKYFFSPYDLLTHCIILGVTGSGKTILGKILMEEAALHGIPSIAIDLKGDLASMALFFPEIQPKNFKPWIEIRRGENKEKKAERIARLYQEKFDEFEITRERLHLFLERVNVVILTPKSGKGIPIAISPLPSPPENVLELMEEDPETVLNMIDTLARSLIERLYPGEPPSKHVTEEKFLSALIYYAWENQIPLEGNEGLEKLISFIESPPIQKIGAMRVQKVMPARARHDLAIRVNNLLIGAEQLWHVGDPLNLDLLLSKYSENGRKTPILVINLSEIQNIEEQMFVVSRIGLEIYRWMRTKGGSADPRLIFYIDEIGGGGGKQAFFPSYPFNPISKVPLLLLVKQGRSFGVCCIFATQNPGDIDYKGLSNCGTWIIGKLPTAKDREKVLQGLAEAEIYDMTFSKSDLEDLLVHLQSGEFLVRSKRIEIALLKERWLMSYHKTLSPQEIKRITRGEGTWLVPGLTRARELLFLSVEHPATLEEVRKHFRGNFDGEIIRAEYSSNILLRCKPVATANLRHPLLKERGPIFVEYSAIVAPLFEEIKIVDLEYASRILGLNEEDLDKATERNPNYDIKLPPLRKARQETLDALNLMFLKKAKNDLGRKLKKRIKEAKKEEIDNQRMKIKPKLDNLNSRIEEIEEDLSDFQTQIISLEGEIEELNSEMEWRQLQGKPTTRVRKSIRVRERKILEIQRKMERLNYKKENLQRKKDGILANFSTTRKQIEEKYKQIEGVLLQQVKPIVEFRDIEEFVVPISDLEIKLIGKERSKVVEFSWNAYNGLRLSKLVCEVCGEEIPKEDRAGVCYSCLKLMCEKDSVICDKCNTICCEEHSWKCSCGRTYCLEEERFSCEICEATICSECMSTCEICGNYVCNEHSLRCSKCETVVCTADSWQCASCGKSFCRYEESTTCEICGESLCPDCVVTCSFCGKEVCPDHTFTCQDCGRSFCNGPDHYRICNVCGKKFCNECVEECPGCHEWVCKEDMVTCPNCGSKICKSCLREKKIWLGIKKKVVCVLCEESG